MALEEVTNVKEHVLIFCNQTETLQWYANMQGLTMNMYVRKQKNTLRRTQNDRPNKMGN